MRMALDEARASIGLASPNPCVGCLIVTPGGVIAGRGRHLYDDRLHAEPVALREAGGKARGATVYVTLEPCAHTGRTPPCAEALVQAGVARVVCAMQDPNPLVAGKGFAILRKAGIAVETGLCEDEARQLNAPFVKHIRTGLPLVTLKAALSLDAKIAPAPAQRQAGTNYLSSPESLAEVHRLRHAADAILVGIGTALADNPALTDRSGLPRRRPLLRIVLDSKLRLPLESRLVQSAHGDLLVAHTADAPAKVESLRRLGVETLQLPAGGDGRCSLPELLKNLGERKILSLLVEGGTAVNTAFLEGSLADRLLLFYAPILLGAHAVPWIDGTGGQPRILAASSRTFGQDLCVEATLRDLYA
jgi:diaminohydroxyphosphoribosylaminopyrimidine deaminase/5-amino-6-(5-phosphoribosylamino)uracil reductase